MLKIDPLKVIKGATIIGSIGVTAAQSYLADKKLKKMVVEEVEKALADKLQNK